MKCYKISVSKLIQHYFQLRFLLVLTLSIREALSFKLDNQKGIQQSENI